nr:PREDICTED: tumor protein p63-regulated gene 1 protein [Apteryx mantelli mantelli]
MTGIDFAIGGVIHTLVLSRWKPWSTAVPYMTFTEHPAKNCSERFSTACQLTGAAFHAVTLFVMHIPHFSGRDSFLHILALDPQLSTKRCLHSVQLAQAVKRTQSKTPALGRAGRATVLRHPLHTDTYTGLLAFWGDQHKLGYLIAHGNLGF